MTSSSKEEEDLHTAAFMALRGKSDRPERELIALLRSDHDLDPIIRGMIADALEGRVSDGSIRLRAEGLAAGKRDRKWKLLVQNARRGRKAIQMQEQGIRYSDATSAASRKMGDCQRGEGEKTVEANITFARKVDAWIDSVIGSRDEPRFLLEADYCYAVAYDLDPDEILSKRDGAET